MGGESKSADISRGWAHALLWVVLVSVLWSADLLVRFAERGPPPYGKDDLRLIVEQITSALAVLMMIPLVQRWMGLFPLRRKALAVAALAHGVGTVWFAVGHYLLMVLQRMALYAIVGLDYVWRDPFLRNLLLEYQKDLKVYAAIVLITWVIQQRAGSPAALAPEATPPGASAPSRLQVSTGSGDKALLRPQEILFLEGARNYVAVHVGQREYVVRETLSALVQRLADQRFARAHRSYAVNLDRVERIRQHDGKLRLVLEGGVEIPVGDRYREALLQALG